MTRHVSEASFEQMRYMLSSRIRGVEGKVWLTLNGEALIEGHDLIALLDELNKRRMAGTKRGYTRPTSHITEALKLMYIGETIEIEPQAYNALTSKRRTARKQLANPYAVWTARTLPSGLMEITRQPDGTPPLNPRRSPYVAELARLRVGESFTAPIDYRRVSAMKAPARMLLNDTSAKWSYQTLTDGKLRIRRTK